MTLNVLLRQVDQSAPSVPKSADGSHENEPEDQLTILDVVDDVAELSKVGEGGRCGLLTWGKWGQHGQRLGCLLTLSAHLLLVCLHVPVDLTLRHPERRDTLRPAPLAVVLERRERLVGVGQEAVQARRRVLLVMEAAALVARPPGVRVTLFDDDSSRRRRATRPVFLVFSRLLASTLGSGCAGAALESKENLYADGQVRLTPLSNPLAAF